MGAFRLDAPADACPRYGQIDMRDNGRHLNREHVQRLKNDIRDALQVLHIFDLVVKDDVK